MRAFIFCLMFFFFSTAAVAGVDGYYVSAKIGVGDIEGDANVESDPELTYGGNAGILFNDHLSFGVHLNFFRTEFTESTFNNEIYYKIMPVMADMTFYVDDPVKSHSPYLGLMLGVARVTLRLGTLPETNKTDMAAGIRIGYNFNVAHKWSVAPEFSYTHIFSDPSAVKLMTGQILITAWY